MAEIKFAELVFTDDKVKTIVPVNYVRFNRTDEQPISPKNDQDFDREHKYYGRWYYCQKNGRKCDQNHIHEFDNFGANIFNLGGLR